MNKDICERCINKNFQHSWDERDESRWLDGYIWCSVSTMKFDWKKHGIPGGCRYVLEQVVLDNDLPPGDTQ